MRRFTNSILFKILLVIAGAIFSPMILGVLAQIPVVGELLLKLTGGAADPNAPAAATKQEGTL